MQQIEVNLPKLGESILSATIVHWFKKEGDAVRLDEPLLEVATDKINSEIPAPCEGIVVKIHAQNGQELKVGELLVTLRPIAVGEEVASITTTSLQSAESSKGGISAESTLKSDSHCPFEKKAQESAGLPQVHVETHADRANLFAGESMGETFLSPAVLRLAKEYGLPLQSLLEIPGRGEDGRITKRDVEEFIKRKEQERAAAKTASQPVQETSNEEVILPLSPLRKVIAENMERSYKEIPHAYLVQEIDVTILQEKIRQLKEERIAKKLPKLTLTAIVMYALGKVLQRYPLLNASFAWDGIRVKKSIHCGMAVSVEQGVIVPVVKHIETRTIDELAGEIQSLAEKARSSKLQLSHMQGGTFTLTNFGMSGIAMGFPIIKAPEAAILALGTLQNKVLALSEREFGIREVMQITLAFDHRIFDGIYACQFLKELQTYLEKPFDDSRICL